MNTREGRFVSFIREFGFYIFILFSTFIISLFETFLPRVGASKEIQEKISLLEGLLQEKMIQFYRGTLEYKSPFLYICGLLISSIFILAFLLFLYQIYKMLTGKKILPPAKFSPYPIWSLKDFFKILIWILFWIELISVGTNSYLYFSGQKGHFAISLLGSLLLDILVFLILLIWLKRYYGQNYRALGIYKGRVGLDLKLALKFYLAFLPVLFYLIYVSINFLRKYQRPTVSPPIFYFLMFEENPLLLILAIFFITIIGPFVEEMFFRGLLYNCLKKSIGVFQGMLASSILFALLHMNLMGFLPILGLSLLFTYLYERTGSLTLPIFIHMFHNGFLLFLLFTFKLFLMS